MALVHDVCTHGRRGGLTVCSSKAQSFVRACEGAEHLSSLLDGEASLAEVLQLFVLLRYGGRVDNETRLCVAASLWYLIGILFIVNEHTLFFQLTC